MAIIASPGSVFGVSAAEAVIPGTSGLCFILFLSFRGSRRLFFAGTLYAVQPIWNRAAGGVTQQDRVCL